MPETPHISPATPTDPTPIAIAATTDPILRECAAFDVAIAEPGTAAFIQSFLPDGNAIHHLVIDAHGVHIEEIASSENECLNCAANQDALDTLERLIRSEQWRKIAYFPPLGWDPFPLARTVGEALTRSRLPGFLSSVAAVVDTSAAVEDLLEPITAGERGLIGPDPESTVGEALLAQITFADLIVAHGGNGPGRELVEHLRSFDTLAAEDLHDGDVHPLLFNGHHEPLRAFARVDPANVQAWGGPDEFGTWTLDLNSKRPFHPDRLLENVELLGAGPLVHRGRFWVPTRPDTMCTWEGAGGQVSVGSAGTHPDGITTRLTITGRGDERERLERAFSDSLLTDAEWGRQATYWFAQTDALEPWLGAAS